jgi:hypothetical protein
MSSSSASCTAFGRSAAPVARALRIRGLSSRFVLPRSRRAAHAATLGSQTQRPRQPVQRSGRPAPEPNAHAAPAARPARSLEAPSPRHRSRPAGIDRRPSRHCPADSIQLSSPGPTRHEGVGELDYRKSGQVVSVCRMTSSAMSSWAGRAPTMAAITCAPTVSAESTMTDWRSNAMPSSRGRSRLSMRPSV